MKREVEVAVKPLVIRTSDDLKCYDPETRQCYFKNERKLKIFHIYEQNNCRVECLSNTTRKLCGCTKFSMPRDNETRICKFSDIPCYNIARKKFLLTEIKKTSGENQISCNCLPSCNSIKYDALITSAKITIKKVIEALKKDNSGFFENEVATETNSKLVIFFEESHFIARKRSERYGFIDFVANFGGLLGESYNGNFSVELTTFVP